MTPEIRAEFDRLRELALINLQTSNNNLEAIAKLEKAQSKTQRQIDALGERQDRTQQFLDALGERIEATRKIADSNARSIQALSDRPD
ncbi:hypothetical protein [Synechococcus sp. PCC 7336]|uniref:hypothetical protein n=1 Tax=Synechococcus sp. PCC 7336 TaxID=195250 RepID=UPI000344A82D|nr:hypothetical protein [Synechococcus sp. PCC 7336]